ncbi:5'-methylthioadenosine/S-adenosylhomocysteine nucleosidase [Streptomyces sp. TLI_185]|uniref:5'-methylthioadenosine/S-adenosylhomocysteine nucleosidase n=1 Tax=Streptomyces sp. TLI_185 TaxID=2485151 RepID=UPI000FBF10A1|nr:5'-methylthioadenosine/S-adenosylhomocysteine nucleosidase [Streptomyces sp. TLI_185]RPF33172.1 nucleoside phosphorylase [Streptomyces sp. TLI_185]
MPPTVVVLTALSLEFQAVRRHLSHVREVEHPQGTLFDVGRVPGLAWQVALVEIGDGNTGAAALTERAIAFFEPAAVFFVGVAGSLREDIALGDVVVASKVYLHHGGKEGDDGFRARPRAWEPRHDVEQRVRRAVREDPRVHFKPLVAGDVVLNSRTSPLAELIERSYNDAVAIDMESAGMAQAAHLNDIPVLAVRGISDFADGGKAVTDAKGSQPVAARNAASVALRLLRTLPLPRTRPEPADPPHTPAVVVASPPAEGPHDTAEWRGGAVVAVDGEKCLLHDGPDDLLAETASSDHSVVRRQALAHVLPAPGRASRFVWLRQVLALYDGPQAEAALRALSDEHGLLRRLGRGRDVVHYGRRGGTATLALEWPLSRRSGTPCETLAALMGDGSEPLDAWRSHHALRGLVSACGILSRLHEKGLTHRALQPTALVLDDDGRLLLRDLGLAATAPVPGEAPGPYQAPEQGLGRRGRAGGAGAATDVYRIGALVHRLLSGAPPVPGMPSALRRAGEPLPVPAVETVEAALSPDPRVRPDLRGLTAALRILSDGLAGLAREEQ